MLTPNNQKIIKFKLYKYKADCKLKNQKANNSPRKRETIKRKTKMKFAAPLKVPRINSNILTNAELSLEKNALPSIPEEKLTPRFFDKIEESKAREEIKEKNANEQYFNNQCVEVNLYDRTLDFEKILSDNSESNPKSLIIQESQNKIKNPSTELPNSQGKSEKLSKNEYMNSQLQNYNPSSNEILENFGKKENSSQENAKQKNNLTFDEICYPNVYSMYPNLLSQDKERYRYFNYDNEPKRKVIQVSTRHPYQAYYSNSISQVQEMSTGLNQDIQESQNEMVIKNPELTDIYENRKQIFIMSKKDLNMNNNNSSQGTNTRDYLNENRNTISNNYFAKNETFKADHFAQPYFTGNS